MAPNKKIWLSRHGESEYNTKGLIGGDSILSERGERYARALPGVLFSRLPQADPSSPVSVWTSTLRRTNMTARFLPFSKLRWRALDEINAGICDGMTYKQIAEQYPEEFEARKADKLAYRYPSGESYLDVVQRVQAVVQEAEHERGNVVIVSHQATLRAIYALLMKIPLEQVPRLEMPLHTLIELTVLPDGSMSEVRIPVDISCCSSSGSSSCSSLSAMAAAAEGALHSLAAAGTCAAAAAAVAAAAATPTFATAGASSAVDANISV